MEKIKVVVISVFSVLTSMLGNLAIPVYLLVGCNVIDYITGLIASKYRDEDISSYKGIRGIAKKVCMWLLVIVGVWVDILLEYAIDTTGIDIALPFIVSIVVSIWLVANEMISILENLNDIGVSLPPFLMPIIKRLKSQVEAKTEIEEEGGNDEQ